MAVSSSLLGRYHSAAKSVDVSPSISSAAEEDVAAAEENWLAATSNGLPPPLCSELPVDWLLALVAVQLAGILGASKICDVSDDVTLDVD